MRSRSARAWVAGVVALVVLAGGAGLGALPASAQGRCVPRPGTQECLARMFADGGRYFNAKAWQRDIERANGNSPNMIAKYKAKFEALLQRAKTQAEKNKLVARYAKLVGTTSQTTPVPSWSRVDAVCKHLMTSQGYRYDSGLCKFWWQNFVIITGWQMDRAGGVTKIIVSGYLADEGPVRTTTVATLQFPGAVPMPNTAAWTAVDSPLPLIAWFKNERKQVYVPGTTKMINTIPLGMRESASVSQLLGLWGWGDANVEFSTALRKLLADADFNPVAAGGPNVLPGAAWPAFGTRGTVTATQLRDAGWLHPFPEKALWSSPVNPIAVMQPTLP